MTRKNILKLSFIALIIGVTTGLMISLFLVVLEKAIALNQSYPFLILGLPLSGLLMTYLYKHFGHNAKKGNNLIIENVNGSQEKIHLIMAPLVFLGTVLTHLFGGSVGREGTGVQIGGSISAYLSDLFHIKQDEKKILLICGIAAGFASVFGTPLTGIVFGVEIALIGNISYMALVPALVAALSGDGIGILLKIDHTHFLQLNQVIIDPLLILKVVLMAIVFGLTSKLFVWTTSSLKALFASKLASDYTRIVVGACIMIVATLLIGNNDYNNLSLDLMSRAFEGDVEVYSFLIKLFLTALCLSVGFQGGEVTPLFVIGSTLGAVIAPVLGIDVALGAALGLIGVFAASTNAPIASFILFLELFGGNNLVLGLTVAIISVFISGKRGIYSSQEWIE